MIYHITTPSKTPIYGNMVYNSHDYCTIVTESSDKLLMYRNSCLMATLDNGYKTLNKKYKGSFEDWIRFIKNKDMAKILHNRTHLKHAQEQLDFHEKIWLQDRFGM